MPNVLQYTQIFQKTLDDQVTQISTTGWMESNAGQVIYNGGNTVKIPTMSMDGLANYDRNSGYVAGSVNLAYNDYTMTQDRGRAFTLDAMDVNESNFIVSAGMVMGEFQRMFVVPEIDAYRYAKIASLDAAGGCSRDLAITGDGALTELLADIAMVQDAIGEIPLNITLTTAMVDLLAQDPRFRIMLGESDGTNAVGTKIKSLNDNPLRTTPSARLYDSFIFNDGETDGQTQGGFTPTTGAKKINWQIAASDAPIAVSKQDLVRVFDPTTTQNMNAWKIDYRKFHELWITSNKLVKTFTNFAAAA